MLDLFKRVLLGRAGAGSHMRRGHQGRVDIVQTAIVEALRDVGASVQSLAAVGGGCPDLLVWWGGETRLLECKSAKGKARDSQEKWTQNWRGPLPITARTPEEALRAIGAIR